jgi:hypothetical protein
MDPAVNLAKIHGHGPRIRSVNHVKRIEGLEAEAVDASYGTKYPGMEQTLERRGYVGKSEHKFARGDAGPTPASYSFGRVRDDDRIRHLRCQPYRLLRSFSEP